MPLIVEGKLEIFGITLVVVLEVGVVLFQILQPGVEGLEFANDTSVVILALVVIPGFEEFRHIFEQCPTLSFGALAEVLSVFIEEYPEFHFLL